MPQLLCAAFRKRPFATASNSGIDRRNFDTSVRIQDDLYRHVNGNWLKQVQLPADKSRWGTFDELRENSLANLRSIIETMPKDAAAAKGSEAQKLVDAYASFVDEAGRDALGYKPVQLLLAHVDAIADKNQLPALMAEWTQIGIGVPYTTIVNQDAKDSSKYAVLINQAGLGLPDRDYYLGDADEKNRGIRVKYVELISKLLKRAGENNMRCVGERRSRTGNRVWPNRIGRGWKTAIQ